MGEKREMRGGEGSAEPARKGGANMSPGGVEAGTAEGRFRWSWHTGGCKVR